MTRSMQVESLDYNKKVVLVHYEDSPKSQTQTEEDTSIFNQINVITNEIFADKEFLQRDFTLKKNTRERNAFFEEFFKEERNEIRSHMDGIVPQYDYSIKMKTSL